MRPLDRRPATRTRKRPTPGPRVRKQRITYPWRDPQGWQLLPLRLFLAVVYLDGGISKIADPRFLDPSSSASLRATAAAARAGSPIGGLLAPVQNHSVAFGIALALAELAVGLGVLLGLFTRVAAAGGMVLALGLWLTVSWHASPWFTSADLVYLIAFTPLLIAGAREWSLDAWLQQAATAHSRRSADLSRRGMLGGATALLGVLILGIAAVARPARRRAPRNASPSHPQVLVPAARVPVGSGVEITAAGGEPVWVLQLQRGAFTAFDARCPHQGCTVSLESAQRGFVCPCHGSRFAANGHLLTGPASRGLSPIPVNVDGGDIRTA